MTEQESFDGLAKLAALAIGAPMAMIATFNRDKICLKSKFGPVDSLEEIENPALAEIVSIARPNAIANFSECPLVADLLRLPLFQKVRSMVSAPVFCDDSAQPVGAVVALDCSPRQFAAEQISAICYVAHAVSNELRVKSPPFSVSAREDYLALVAHELKTPISSVSMVLQLLLRNARKQATIPSEKVLRSVESARRQIDSLNRLVDKLLDLSRLSRGDLELELEKVELASLVSEVAARLQSMAQWASCPLTVSVECAAEGEWDRTRLEQVVTNLITNALKYGAKKPVHVCVKADQQLARVCVQDQGIGIAPEHLNTIFKRFGRATQTHRCNSMGLGLYISHEIAKAHGGRIYVESELGKGSVFTLELPLHSKAMAKPALRIL